MKDVKKPFQEEMKLGPFQGKFILEKRPLSRGAFCMMGPSMLVGLSKIGSLSDDAEAPQQLVLAALGVSQRPERLHGGVQAREERRVDGGEATPPVGTAAPPKFAVHLNQRIEQY